MSRGIKFRAWDTVNNYMVEPSKYLLQLDGRLFFNNDGDLIDHTSKLVKMQFTGLTDKNGMELYYNCDLVKLPEFTGFFIAVKDSFDIPCFIRPDNCLKEVIQFDDYFLQGSKRGDDFEIIGNIHEHPELLK